MFSFWQGCSADRIAAPVMLEAGSAAPCGVDLEDSMQWMRRSPIRIRTCPTGRTMAATRSPSAATIGVAGVGGGGTGADGGGTCAGGGGASGAGGVGGGGIAAGAAWMSARSPSATRLNAPS